MPSKRELEEENAELREENERLQDRLDQIVNVAAPDEDDDEDDADEDGDEAEDEDGDEAEDEDEDDESDEEAIAAAAVPPRDNGIVTRFVSRKAAERRYEKAVARKAVADARLERARARLSK